MKVIRCSQKDCLNSVSLPDAMDDAQVEAAMARVGGWTKNDDGTWNGCGAPVRCPMIQPPPPAEKE